MTTRTGGGRRSAGPLVQPGAECALTIRAERAVAPDRDHDAVPVVGVPPPHATAERQTEVQAQVTQQQEPPRGP